MFALGKPGIRSLVLAVIAGIFAFLAPATAQTRDPWPGFYVGGNSGYAWAKALNETTTVGRISITNPFTAVFDGSDNAATVKPSGWFGGLQAGHVWRMAPNWLAGVETDFQWANQKDTGVGGFVVPISASFCDSGPNCTAYDNTSTVVKLEWFGTARARVGVDFGRLWAYATAGLAYGRVSISTINSFRFVDVTVPTAFTAVSQFQQSQVSLGYAIGGGVEGVIESGLWSWKFEYLYINLDLDLPGSIALATNPPVGIRYGAAASFVDQIVRFGISYHFAGSPWP